MRIRVRNPESKKVRESLLTIVIEPTGKLTISQKKFVPTSQCLKITDKVSFNIASEASYVYILGGQKFTKNAEKGQFWRVFESLKLAVKQCYQIGHF